MKRLVMRHVTDSKGRKMGSMNWREHTVQKDGKLFGSSSSFLWFAPVLILLPVLFSSLPVSLSAAETKVDFAREIRPILAKKCFACHGPDEEHREGGLRLDLQEGATKKLETGAVAVVAGKSGESELIKRVVSTNDD